MVVKSGWVQVKSACHFQVDLTSDSVRVQVELILVLIDVSSSQNSSGPKQLNTRFLRREFSPVRFLKNFGRKVAKGLMTFFRPSPPKLTSSSSSSRGSKPFVTHVVDSHRNAAVEDCIRFINSSASLPTSNSVSGPT
ncbi:josephin-like protein [Hibiscus syriacus]|uniref:josephin-like protein n=1 Tax=Hibiscus syriacus TaxID=106335 RepID=UPI0019246108|nr:josephin-like protein [Hibiscus syriacus]